MNLLFSIHQDAVLCSLFEPTQSSGKLFKDFIIISTHIISTLQLSGFGAKKWENTCYVHSSDFCKNLYAKKRKLKTIEIKINVQQPYDKKINGLQKLKTDKDTLSFEFKFNVTGLSELVTSFSNLTTPKKQNGKRRKIEEILFLLLFC